MTCALLIAFDEYERLGNLPSAESDLVAIKETCKEKFQVDDEHMEIAPRKLDSDFILPIVDRFCRDNSGIDSFIFYYSGHGGVLDNGSGQEEFALYGTDGRPLLLSYVLRRLTAAFSHGLIMLDSCHSGSVSIDASSFDFLNQTSNGFTVIASSDVHEPAYASSVGCPSVFTGVLKMAFDAIVCRNVPYFPVSGVIDAVNAGIGFCNERNPARAMHPVCINKYACDGAFPTGAKPYGNASPFEFEHSGFHFAVSNMNSHDYRRVRAAVLPNGSTENELAETLSILKSHAVIERICRHSIYENDKQKGLLSNKRLSYILFEIFPDEIDMRVHNPKWLVHWANTSAPYIDLCRNPYLVDGPLKVEYCEAHQSLRRGYEENNSDNVALARKLSAVYTKLRFLMEELGSAFDLVVNGKLSELDFAEKCRQLQKMIDKVSDESCDLPYSSDSDVLESDVAHLMGMAGALANISRVCSSSEWRGKTRNERLSCIKTYLDMCAASHRRLFEKSEPV